MILSENSLFHLGETDTIFQPYSSSFPLFLITTTVSFTSLEFFHLIVSCCPESGTSSVQTSMLLPLKLMPAVTPELVLSLHLMINLITFVLAQSLAFVLRTAFSLLLCSALASPSSSSINVTARRFDSLQLPAAFPLMSPELPWLGMDS